MSKGPITQPKEETVKDVETDVQCLFFNSTLRI